ncbi:MAG: 2-phospho-L-lactate transferase [Euryarchaeota archaeon]|nr:2-phospho-L-lactate transferase [Euryarchaeota archaeon]MBU4339629.1 2-phospho-L-lactate transferase [Euryarchaeota archaeon]MCG2737411.1 2-phospho-L-lactate transferase [Candidatus Methanoperedenaceae archaeon]
MIVLSGGTGTPKLLQGLRRLIPDEEITVIVNTAEDIMISGNLVSPDVDTVLYLFSGQLDDAKWWGVRNDTFHTHTALKKMGVNEMLMMGDADRATHIMRSELMRKGARLTRATAQLSRALRVRAKVLPMCDEKVDTMIKTPQGEMHFQDFWVGAHGEPDVIYVTLKGIEKANATKEVMKALGSEDRVLIGPSNPITSIGPILSLKHMRGILSFKKVIAISPIIGDGPVSGPAGKLMRARGFPVSSKGVAECYGDILDMMVIDDMDNADDRDFPVRTTRYDTMMTSVEKSEALARRVLELFNEL